MMLSESPRVQKVKDENSDAFVRCGQSRSSVETTVMVVEQRGLVIRNPLYRTTKYGRIL